MKKTISCILISLFFIILWVEQADAQRKKKNIVYKKRSAVDFSDELIEGRAENPEGIYVVSPPRRKFKGLLKLRTNFHKELIRDSLLLK